MSTIMLQPGLYHSTLLGQSKQERVTYYILCSSVFLFYSGNAPAPLCASLLSTLLQSYYLVSILL
eukprot:9498190-Pyramimonas_sp.AAC.1